MATTYTTSRQTRFYAVAYPNGRAPGQPRTLRVFYSLAARGAWIDERLSDFPEGWGYRETIQAAAVTPRERDMIRAMTSRHR